MTESKCFLDINRSKVVASVGWAAPTVRSGCGTFLPTGFDRTHTNLLVYSTDPKSARPDELAAFGVRICHGAVNI